MKIVLHDYGGYAFTVDLARRLAQRGHQVSYLYAAHNPTPHGQLETRADDPDGFDSRGLRTDRPLHKDRLLSRWRQERDYGRLLGEAVAENSPEVLLSANTPIDALWILRQGSQRAGIPLVYWLQDLIGLATSSILSERLGSIGALIGAWYGWRERRLISTSQAVIVIAESFCSYLERHGIRHLPVEVVPNWAPIDSLPMDSKTNDWAHAHGLAGSFCYLYSGSLGMKHDIQPLLGLAEVAQAQGATLAVVSQGPAAERLAQLATDRGLTSLRLIPLQSMEVYPQVLAAGDVLVGILEAQTAEFSVPSKLYSYLCAGRPILLHAPLSSSSAELIGEAEAGLVAEPGDDSAWEKAARRMFTDNSMRAVMGHKARAYAERTFDLEAITDRFERILMASVRQ